MGKDIFELDYIPRPNGLIAGGTTYFTVPVEHLNTGSSPMFDLVLECDGEEIVNARCGPIEGRKTENIKVSARIEESGLHKIKYTVKLHGARESWETRYYTWESSLPIDDYIEENMEDYGNDNSRYPQRIYDDENIIGQVDKDDDVDWYIVSFDKNGSANFWVKPLHTRLDMDIYVYDQDDLVNYIKCSTESKGEEDLVTIPVEANRNYYVKIEHFGSIPAGMNRDKYWLRCKIYPEYIETFLDVAMNEVGYKETGENNTKFGKWYGMNYNPWCAMFVSWCADRAEILRELVPKHSYTPSGVSWFKRRNKYRYRGSGYNPKAGDVVYFYSESKGRVGHVGIVVAYDLENDKLYTVEGNSSDSVKLRYYTSMRNNAYVHGFGVVGGGSYGVIPSGASPGKNTPID